MIDLLSLNSDFAALVRAGCSIRFDPIPSMYGVIEVQVTITPSKPTFADEWAASLGVHSGPLPYFFKFNILDENALAKGFQQARFFLLAQPPRSPSAAT